MELADGTRDVVDPEVRAYVSSLVSALGGTGADEDGRYVLGDDAFAVLRDLKRWLRLYDEKANRLDVARCLAESNLVGGDLLPILAAWPENATEDRVKSKIALACLELLVPLTWPYEKDMSTMTVNHHRHIPYLELSQVSYKRLIINFDGARILHTAVRTALPSLSESLGDRNKRDVGIIRLVLYFLRNIAMIAPPANVKYDGDESEISRSATIDAYNYQDIFHLLLTISATMGEEFNTEDVLVLEVLFHLIKGVDAQKVFMTEAEIDANATDQLLSLRGKEANMKRQYARNAATRHNRFGTMIWVKRDDAKVSTLSGQDALISGKSLDKMDKSKKFKPPRRTPKEDVGPKDFDTPVSLTMPAYAHLRKFVSEFLDSGFNPLFQHLRKSIDREAERVLGSHRPQFFYLVSWFLEADRIRRSLNKKHRKTQTPEELNDFALVASVLNQEMFITLNRAMEKAYDEHAWGDLKATMRCFTQILLTVEEMFQSPIEDDSDIAENILSRIFYEETTHDRIANIVRQFKDQGFGYLDLCTELAHNYLRILEGYSKRNQSLQVRSTRRARRKKKSAKTDDLNEVESEPVDSEEEEDEEAVARLTRERKFDFKRFASKFTSQGCIDTFVTFAGYYNDLTDAQLKRAHRFFYRIAFRMDQSVMLFRVDIIALLHRMIKGPDALDKASSMYKEMEELVRQILKKCIRKIEERPELIVEMLFSKTSATAFYLEYGHEKQTLTSRSRVAAQLDFIAVVKEYDKVGVLVAVLLDEDHGNWVEWVKTELEFAADKRKAWEQQNKALPSVETETILPEDDTALTAQPKAPVLTIHCTDSDIKQALFKNGHLRLLMTTVGMQLISDNDEPDTIWVIPSSITSEQLSTSANSIKLRVETPLNIEEEYGPYEPRAFFRRKMESLPSKNRSAIFGDDSDDEIENEEFLFPAGGPTIKPSEALKELKKSRQRRKRTASEEPTEEELEARRAARRAKELEKLRRFKSDLFVHDSDEEFDEEREQAFFANEEKLRKQTSAAAIEALVNGGSKNNSKLPKRKKRGSSMISSDSEDEVASGSSILSRSKRARADSEDEDMLDTPISSQQTAEAEPERQKPKTRTVGGFVMSDSDEDDEVQVEPVVDKSITAIAASNEDLSDEDLPVARPIRQRARGGFLIDDSDDE